MKVQKVIEGTELVSNVDSYMKAIIIFDNKWRAKEVPSLHRLFPSDVIAMFWYWYDPEQSNNDDIVMDEDHFIDIFEEVLKRKNVGFERVPCYSNYNLSQGRYKYKFSNLRLTKRGLRIYLNLLRD